MINCQPSLASFQSSAVSQSVTCHQPSVIRGQSSLTRYQLSVIGPHNKPSWSTTTQQSSSRPQIIWKLMKMRSIVVPVCVCPRDHIRCKLGVPPPGSFSTCSEAYATPKMDQNVQEDVAQLQHNIFVCCVSRYFRYSMTSIDFPFPCMSGAWTKCDFVTGRRVYMFLLQSSL